MALEPELVAHLSSLPAAPFLFIGSGFSRRYAQLDDWETLLRHFAALTDHPYERYSSRASGDLPKIATLIAEDFHDIWWAHDDYKTSRSAYPSPKDVSSPLKIEVALKVAEAVKQLPKEGPLFEELELLKLATVEGLITTNYDPLLEHIFPDYSVFAGQDELLFHEAAGVGEIYKIHGSYSKPETLVLTEHDYSRFNERNAYLAAKLLTIFVEHPVVFVGYSLSDPNVREILKNIAKVLTRDNVTQLQDRLIFLEWQDGVEDGPLSPIPFQIEGLTLPMVGATVGSYAGLFRALGAIRRRFPTKFLRELKEEVYELVTTSEPKGRLYVMDIDSDVDVSQVDVVVGVGIHSRLAAQGVVGLTRRNLLDDILQNTTVDDDQHLMREIVSSVLPLYLRGATNTPVYRYLKFAGHLDDHGNLKDESAVPKVVAKRARERQGALRAPRGYIRRALENVRDSGSLEVLISTNTVLDAMFAIPHMPIDALNTNLLRQFLIDNEELTRTGHALHATQWAKCICFLDLAENGPTTPVT